MKARDVRLNAWLTTRKPLASLLRSCFVGSIGMGWIVALIFAWLPLPTAIGHYVIDDAAYYLLAARVAASGGPVSLDGSHVTNGFHPLWFVILYAIERVATLSPPMMLHVALTLCAAAFIATGWLLYRLLREGSMGWLALPLTALFAANYRVIAIPLAGLETGVYGIGVVLLAMAAERFSDGPGVRRAAWLGAAIGVACLARLDALLLGSVLLAWFLVVAKAPLSRRVGLLAISAGIALLLLVPWFAFSWRTVHHWLPRSGEAILAWRSAWSPFPSGSRLTQTIREVFVRPAGDFANILGVWPISNTPTITHLSAALVFVVALALAAGISWRTRRSPRVRRLGWIPIYVVLHTAYYFQFDSGHTRYLYPVLILSMYFAANVIGALCEEGNSGAWMRRVPIVVAAMIAIGFVAGVQAYHATVGVVPTHGIQPVWTTFTIPWVRSNTPESSRIGAFNGGLVGYLSGRRLVNLDGVMNDSVIEPLERGGLCDYLRRESVDYLVDNEEAIVFFMGRDASCDAWRSQWKLVYRVLWPQPVAESSTAFVVFRRVDERLPETRANGGRTDVASDERVTRLEVRNSSGEDVGYPFREADRAILVGQRRAPMSSYCFSVLY